MRLAGNSVVIGVRLRIRVVNGIRAVEVEDGLAGSHVIDGSGPSDAVRVLRMHRRAIGKYPWCGAADQGSRNRDEGRSGAED